MQLSAHGASKSQDNIKNGYYTFNWHYFGIFHCTMHCPVLCIQAGKTAENRPFSCQNSRSRLYLIDLKQRYLEKICCQAALGLCFTSDHPLGRPQQPFKVNESRAFLTLLCICILTIFGSGFLTSRHSADLNIDFSENLFNMCNLMRSWFIHIYNINFLKNQY